MKKDSILLESGTNEVEILEFLLGKQSFGVNVAKIQAIEQYNPEKITVIPLAPHSMAGMVLFRNRTLPLIDLCSELGVKSATNIDLGDGGGTEESIEKRIVLVMEFNQVVSAALIDGVNRIHRISWDQIHPLGKVFGEYALEFTGSVHIEDREILIVDLELIVARLIPKAQMRCTDYDVMQHPRQQERPNVKILLAEDSNTIRARIQEVLHMGNYMDIRLFDNGQSTYKALSAFKERAEREGADLSKYVSIVISDIEMPQMDGLTLCRKIKRELGLSQIPVVLFSSLINEQMARKCVSVQADDFISKPEIGKLIQIVDRFCLGEDQAAPPEGASDKAQALA